MPRILISHMFHVQSRKRKKGQQWSVGWGGGGGGDMRFFDRIERQPLSSSNTLPRCERGTNPQSQKATQGRKGRKTPPPPQSTPSLLFLLFRLSNVPTYAHAPPPPPPPPPPPRARKSERGGIHRLGISFALADNFHHCRNFLLISRCWLLANPSPPILGHTACLTCCQVAAKKEEGESWKGKEGGDGMAVRFCEQVIECRMQVAGRRREFSELFWDAKLFGK